MTVYRLERGQQPRAAFAVEAADRAAQAVDRLAKLFAFCNARALLLFELGQFVGGNQVDRTNPFALALHAVEAAGLCCRVVHRAFVEVQFLR